MKKMFMVVALVLAMVVSGCGIEEQEMLQQGKETESGETKVDETVIELESVKESESVIEPEYESEANAKVENETVQEADTQIQDSLETETDSDLEAEVPDSETMPETDAPQQEQGPGEKPVEGPEINTESENSKESEPEKEEKEEIVYTYTDLEKTMYAKASINVRTLPTTKGTRIGTLAQAEGVQVTGQCNETGWYRIVYNNQTAYVSNNYLVDKKPYIPEVEYEEEEEKSIFEYPYTNILYTEEDALNDGLDEYRMGLHKYTYDGKWQLYQLKDWTFPNGNTYYGYFSTNLDVEWEEWYNEKYDTWVLQGFSNSEFHTSVLEMENRYFSTVSYQSVDFLDQYFRYKEVNPDLVHWGDNSCRAYEFVGLSFNIPESEFTVEQEVCRYEEIKALYHYMIVGMLSEGFTDEEWFVKALERQEITYEEFLEFEKVAEKYNYDDYMKTYYAPGGKNHYNS